MNEGPDHSPSPDPSPVLPRGSDWRDHGPDTCALIQEAESRKYGNEIVMVLPLRDSYWAVFNAARELQGFAMGPDLFGLILLSKPPRAPAKPAASPAAENLLSSLGL